MATSTLKTRIILNNKTTEQWAQQTGFVPLKGEVCIYSDTNKAKIGDGSTSVGDLKFAWITPEEVDLLNAAVGEKADKTALLYTNSTPTVQAHGGVAAGTTFKDMPITDVLNKILYPYVAPTVTASVISPSNGGTFEKGSTKTITTIRAVVTKKSATITKVEITDGGTIVATKSGSDIAAVNSSGTATNVDFTVNLSVTANKTYSAKVYDADKGTTVAASANTGTFTFVYPYYHGVIAAGATVNETAVKALTKKIEAKGTKTIAYTASNQKMVFAAPVANGKIKTITDPNGFNVTDTFTESTVSITGLDGTAQSYYVYVSDPTTVTAFNMKFAH